MPIFNEEHVNPPAGRGRRALNAMERTLHVSDKFLMGTLLVVLGVADILVLLWLADTVSTWAVLRNLANSKPLLKALIFGIPILVASRHAIPKIWEQIHKAPTDPSS